MRSLFTFIIIASILLCTACSDKNSNKKPKDTNLSDNSLSKPLKKIKNTFTITDIDNRSTTISFIENRIKVNKITQPIVIMNIFAKWSSPSRGMIPYLNTLQKKYTKDIFVIGIPANSDSNSTQLRDFMKRYSSSYFISNSPDNNELASRLASLLKLKENFPIPITIVFRDGEYNTHYVGATPIEMIKSDIEQLKRR